MPFTKIKGSNIDQDTTINVANISISNTSINDQIKNQTMFTANFHQQGDLQVITGTARWYAPFNLQISTIKARLGTAADGTVTVLIKKNGSTAKTVTFSANTTTATIADQTISMNENDYLTVDVTAIGNTNKGSNLYIQYGYKQV